MKAAHNGRINICQLLVRLGGSVNAIENVMLRTPLHFAVEAQAADVITFLIMKGADIGAENSEDENPVKLAEYLDHGAMRNVVRTAIIESAVQEAREFRREGNGYNRRETFAERARIFIRSLFGPRTVWVCIVALLLVVKLSTPSTGPVDVPEMVPTNDSESRKVELENPHFINTSLPEVTINGSLVANNNSALRLNQSDILNMFQHGDFITRIDTETISSNTEVKKSIPEKEPARHVDEPQPSKKIISFNTEVKQNIPEKETARHVDEPRRPKRTPIDIFLLLLGSSRFDDVFEEDEGKLYAAVGHHQHYAMGSDILTGQYGIWV